jgi:cysteine synthase A
LDSIGNTALVQLRKVVPPNSADIFVKLEWQNPTGSMKDRMAFGAISKAEQDGRLKPGDTIVEYTGGSTGASLALVCTAKGYPIKIVTSDAFSLEKRNQIRAFGAELTIIPSEGGLSTKKLFLEMIETARKMSEAPNHFWFNQIENPDTIAGYLPLGEEIWKQTSGRVDAFVHGIGTGASSRGVLSVLKRHNPALKALLFEPAESPILSGGEAGAHGIEGVGIGFLPSLFDRSLIDGFIPVSTADAQAMARRLAREEGLFAGTSSGANVVAAMRLAEQLGPGQTIVTLMIDSGLKYVNTDLYRG